MTGASQINTDRRWNWMLVDDDDEHALLIERAIAIAAPSVDLYRYPSSDAAASALAAVAAAPDRRPDLILLDLQLVGEQDGLEFLCAVKTSRTLRLTPVLMLSSSSAPPDVVDSLINFANAYLVKPVRFDELVVMIRRTFDFWCMTSKAAHAAPKPR